MNICRVVLVFTMAIIFMTGLLHPVHAADKAYNINLGDDMKLCTKNEDCVLVEQGCNGCCHYSAVSTDQQKTFKTMHDRVCKGYEPGPACDCFNPINKPVCIDGLCQLVEGDELPKSSVPEK